MTSSALCPHILQEYFKRIREISDAYKPQIVQFVQYDKISDSLLNRKILLPEEDEALQQLSTNEQRMAKALEIFGRRMWGLENLISVMIEANVDSWLVDEMFQKYVHHIVNEIRRLQSLRSCRCFEHERRSFIRKAVIRFFQLCDHWLYNIGTSIGFLDQTLFPTRNVLQPINNLLPIPRYNQELIILPSIDFAPFSASYDNSVEIIEVPMESKIPIPIPLLTAEAHKIYSSSATVTETETETETIKTKTKTEQVPTPIVIALRDSKSPERLRGKAVNSPPASPKPINGTGAIRQKTPEVSNGNSRTVLSKLPSSPLLNGKSAAAATTATERRNASSGSIPPNGTGTGTRKSLTVIGNNVGSPKGKTGSNSSANSATTTTLSITSPASLRKIAPVTPTRSAGNNKKPSQPQPMVIPDRFTQFSVDDYNFQQWANEWTSRQEKKKNTTEAE